MGWPTKALIGGREVGERMGGMIKTKSRGGESRVLRVHEHPLSAQVHPLTAKSTLSKLKKNFVKYLVILRSNKNMAI